MDKSTAAAFVDLERAAIGRPVTRPGVSFFPVYLMDNPLPAIDTGPKSGRVIEELPDASVPTLTAANPTERPILLVEGEQFLGGDQNRTLNVSVLVPAAATLKIPVSARRCRPCRGRPSLRGPVPAPRLRARRRRWRH